MACTPHLLRQHKLFIAVGALGLFTLVCGIILGPMVNAEVDKKLKKMMPLVKGTKTYNYWLDPPIPIDFQFHFFHVVNPKEVVQNGAKPVLEERGPYTYRLIDTKENLTHYANFTVSYNEREMFVFQRQLSAGDENETFTTLNLPLITATSLISNEFAFIKEMTKLFFEITKDADLFITLSVKDLIWGYTDSMMAAAKKIFDMFDLPFNDHFGFFYQLNNTIANNYTVYTGEDDLQKISIFTKWNEVRQLPYWTSDTCNMINGTDGSLFHPHTKEEDKLFIFFPQVCRSFYITYENKGVFKGVEYSRYVLKDEVFQNVKDNPSNAGFCTPSHNCLPSGLLNATVCRKGAPVIMSQPHFLGADQSVIDSFIGLNPNRDLHETYIDIVPLTGTLVRTQRTTQINIFVENNTYISQTANIKYFYFPVLFIKEISVLTDSFAAEFKNDLQTPLKIVFYARYICIGTGGFLLLACFTYLTWKICLKQNKQKDTADNIATSIDEHTKLLSNEHVTHAIN